jgi:hypothetical protein
MIGFLFLAHYPPRTIIAITLAVGKPPGLCSGPVLPTGNLRTPGNQLTC